MNNINPPTLLRRYFRSPQLRGDILAVIAGALQALSFAPFEVYPLAILSPAVLFLLWRGCAPAKATWRGFLYGLGHFGVGGSWIYVSMHTYGGMPPPLAAVIVVVFISYLAIYMALLGWLQARFRLSPARHFVLIVPALWTIVEWLRGWLFSGFTWLQLGYSQIETPLSGFAPWLGAYGVTYATSLCAGLLAYAWHARAIRHALAASLAGVAAVFTIGALAVQVQWTEPVDKPLRVALIQGNIDIRQKWLSINRDKIIDRYLDLSFTRGDEVDLIVWPESAIPAYRDEIEADILPKLKSLTAEHKTGLILGTVERLVSGNEKIYYNSAISVGESSSVYRKRHLVPLGEFLPFPWILRWVFDYMHIPMSDFTAGPEQQSPLSAAGQKIAVSICYEGTFGEEIIQALPDATLLVNISEDAWFGDSLAPHQHLEIARMRALETGRSLLRSTNTGISAIVDPRGRLVARSGQFQSEVVTGTVQPMRGATPYVRFGNYPVITAVLLIVIGATFAGFLLNRDSKKQHRQATP